MDSPPPSPVLNSDFHPVSAATFEIFSLKGGGIPPFWEDLRVSLKVKQTSYRKS